MPGELPGDTDIAGDPRDSIAECDEVCATREGDRVGARDAVTTQAARDGAAVDVGQIAADDANAAASLQSRDAIGATGCTASSTGPALGNPAIRQRTNRPRSEKDANAAGTITCDTADGAGATRGRICQRKGCGVGASANTCPSIGGRATAIAAGLLRHRRRKGQDSRCHDDHAKCRTAEQAAWRARR